MLEQLFEESCKAIENHYDESSKKTKLPPELCGYRFLLSSKSTFRADIPIMIIDDHPGPNFKQEGKAQYSRELELKDYPYPSCEKVSAYIGEDWDAKKAKGESKLQTRMRAILLELMRHTRFQGSLNEFALKHILTFYGNPYRKGFSTKFIAPYLEKILNEIHPPLIFVLKKDTYCIALEHLKKNYDVHFVENIPSKMSETITFEIHRVNFKTHSALLVCMAPHCVFPYGKEKPEQKDAVDKMWTYVRTFISDNNL